MLWTLALAFALPDVDDAVRTGAEAPSDAAVVIGIEDYFMLPDVPHADADARAVRGFLRYTRGVPDARIRMLGKGANREQILKAVEELAPTVGADGTLYACEWGSPQGAVFRVADGEVTELATGIGYPSNVVDRGDGVTTPHDRSGERLARLAGLPAPGPFSHLQALAETYDLEEDEDGNSTDAEADHSGA